MGRGPDSGAAPIRIVGVYNADGGLRGEVTYVVGHLLGRLSCELCDLTHSPIRRKRAWDQLVAGFPIPITVVHRNEVPAPLIPSVVAADLPALYAVRADGSADVVVSREELAAMDGSVPELDRLLRARIAP